MYIQTVYICVPYSKLSMNAVLLRARNQIKFQLILIIGYLTTDSEAV